MSAPERGVRRRRKMATRERIIAAATRLLSRHGYAALRVAAVAEEASISLGGQLHHFPSKDSLVIAVLESISEAVLTKASTHIERISEIDDPVFIIAQSAQEFYASQEFLIYLDIHLSSKRDTKIGVRAVEILVEQRASIEDMWLPPLRARGVTEKHALQIIRTIWSLARGLAISSARPNEAGEDDVLEFVLKLISHSFAQDVPAAASSDLLAGADE